MTDPRSEDTALDLGVTIERVLPIARAAADVVMAVYRTDFSVDYKDAREPVTRADKEANALITTELALAYPGIPIVAEEGDASTFDHARGAPFVWYVDPVDGTREFIAKNGEFAVMIGLAVHGRAALGVVVCPALERTFYGADGVGAFEVLRDGTHARIHPSEARELGKATVLVSRSHRSRDAEGKLQQLGAGKLVPCGSAGVKAVKIACGEGDAYVQPGKAGKRWDSCAPEAIVRAAGGRATDGRGRTIEYATAEIQNEHGFVCANAALHPEILQKLAG